VALGAFWQWMVMTFLGPVGARCAITGATVAEHLSGVASPEVLAGMLGLIRQTREDPNIPKRDLEKRASYRHAWWATVRGTVLVAIERNCKVCRNFFEKHGDRFQRPGLHVLQEQVKSRLRLRVKEEVAAVRSGKLTGGDVGLGPEVLNILLTGV
jgi:hypothetical protein